MDVTSLYTNILQEEGIITVCNAYRKFYKDNPPIPTHYLREMLTLILKENSFQFNGKNYLQIHGTAMGTKMAVAFANIFMANIETQILSKNVIKPTVWKRYIDDIFSLWDISKPDIEQFIEQANSHHPTVQSNSRLKSQTLKLHFWIQSYTKAKDSRDNLSLILKHILSQRKLFNAHISPLVTRQVLKWDS